MTTQCPACLSENPDNTSHCNICGYQINQAQSQPQNSSGIHLATGVFLKNGTYQIKKPLGEGGFGITYQGIALSQNTLVAIKELWPEKAARQGNQILWPNKISLKEKQEQLDKYQLEAENQKKCQHPNIPKIYDFFLENNTAYIIMEYIEGETLYSLLKTQGKFSEATLTPYLLQIIDALKVIHNNNLLHRDIKPDNIILNLKSQKISLIDFGSTKEFLAGKTGEMTRVLTPGYAPSEQYIYSAKRDKYSDIYALCASIYELLTNHVPVESLERLNAISHNLNDPLIPPRQIVPEISQKMEKIILTGMRIKVEERFQNLDELLTALQGNFISPLQQKAQQLVKQNKLQEAIQTYHKYLQQQPDDPEASVELALVQIHLNPAQAEIEAQKATTLKPQDGRIYGILGLIKCRQQNWSEALILLEKAAQLAPQEPWIQANLAWALAKSQHWQKAEETINQALQLNPNCSFSLGLQAWIKTHQNDYKSALKYSTQAIFKTNNHNLSQPHEKIKSWVYPYLIFSLEKAVTSQKATDIDRRIEEFIAIMPNNSYAWGLKGWRQTKQKQWLAALSSFKKAGECHDVSLWVLLNQAIILEYLNDISEAIKIYQEVSQKFPHHPLSWFRLGTLTANNNQWQQAKIYLEQSLITNPNYPEAYHNLAWVLVKINDNNAQEIIFNYQQAVYYYQQQNKEYYAEIIKKNLQNIGFNFPAKI